MYSISYFTEAPEMMEKNQGNIVGKITQPNSKANFNSMYLYTVTESEINLASKNLQNKNSSGLDSISDFLVK